MRWLFIKDLQILRRSPLVTTLLVVYPAVIAVLIGFALSRGPETPRVAFLNEVPQGQTLVLAGAEFDIAGARSELCARIDCIPVSNEDEARDMVARVTAGGPDPALGPDRQARVAGHAVALAADRASAGQRGGPGQGAAGGRPHQLFGNAGQPKDLEAGDADLRQLPPLLLEGGNFNLLGQTFNVLGLKNTQRILEALRPELPADSPFAGALDRVIQFSRLARQNLNLANPLLGAIAHPIEVQKEVISGSPPSLDSFAIAVAVTVTLMFVTVLLVGGSLALEREENAFPRLTRGLVGRTALLVEKVGLGWRCRSW